jgi:hypothetical protein
MDHTIAAAPALMALGSVLPWAGKAFWRLMRGQAAREDVAKAAAASREQSEIERLTARVGDLEDLVDVLRKALDRHLIRESAIASACELLIMLASLVREPTEAMLRIRDRAQQLLEDARAQTSNSKGRGNG